MRALYELEEITHRIEHETRLLQLDLATRRVKRATLELHYAGQPRLPGGAPGGGQYTFGDGATGSGMPSGTQLVAAGMGRVTFSGRLIVYWNLGAGWLWCTYHDRREDYNFSVATFGDKCVKHFLNY